MRSEISAVSPSQVSTAVDVGLQQSSQSRGYDILLNVVIDDRTVHEIMPGISISCNLIKQIPDRCTMGAEGCSERFYFFPAKIDVTSGTRNPPLIGKCVCRRQEGSSCCDGDGLKIAELTCILPVEDARGNGPPVGPRRCR